MRLPQKLAGLLILSALAGCPFSSTDDPSPDSPEALFGIWQGLVEGNVETTLRFLDDGSLEVLDAFIDETRCRTASGWWEVADGGFSYSVTFPAGGGDQGSGVYQISGNTLTLEYANGETEVLTRFDGPMPICADYGWPTLQVFDVEVDGVPFDLTNPGPDPLLGLDISLSDIIASGDLWVVASDVGLGDGDCTNCRAMSIHIQSSTGPLTLGTYTYDGPPGADGYADIGYSCCQGFSSPESGQFGSGGIDPVSGEEGSATVTLTVLEPYRIAGTFSGVLHAGAATVRVTGQFEIRYD